MFFDFAVTEPPQSPVFCGAACRRFLSPEGGPSDGSSVMAQFASTAGGGAKNAPLLFQESIRQLLVLCEV
jgi:hypothetical protein